jgi:hypothetical protein
LNQATTFEADELSPTGGAGSTGFTSVELEGESGRGYADGEVAVGGGRITGDAVVGATVIVDGRGISLFRSGCSET